MSSQVKLLAALYHRRWKIELYAEPMPAKSSPKRKRDQPSLSTARPP
jgi:hypothetical protein